MIIFKPTCGLGNQLFLYAVAKALAIKHKTELLVDKSYYSEQNQLKLPKEAGQRCYGLDVFNINVKEMSSYEDKVIRRVRSRNFCKRMRAILPCVLLNSFGPKKHFVCFAEKGPQFDKTVLSLPDNVIFEGFFVSYKYFDHYGHIIRDELSFKDPPNAQNQEIMQNIASVESVSLHIRRGDYITNKIVQDKFGPCSLNYYRRAVEVITERVKSPNFFIFSDDPEWVRDNFVLDYPVVYITHNLGSKDYEDLRLMSLCQHNIIANSSFSWWGAWLNQNPNKIVIGPSPVYNALDIRDEDFYPPSWVLLTKSEGSVVIQRCSP